MKPKRIEECGCCEAGISLTPEPITNRPGLPAISYRVGTYASFRQAMIEAIARSPKLKSWTGRRNDDYGIALIDMWAYLADILTFYQERIANEAFLRTASHRDTIMRLASMLDYKLNPGVTAKYRQGLGSEGNIPADSLATLLDRPIELKRVTNPKEAEGGTDAESLRDARVNAPNTVRTFERAISLRDYEDLARNHTGIAKARAARVFKNENEMIQLTIAGENGQRIEPGSPIYESFLGFLDLHRDINHPLEVIPHSDKLLVLQAIIQVDPAYVEDDVVSVAKTAVLNYFDFNTLQLGQGVHLSDIYVVLQALEGVTAAVINQLDYKASGPALETRAHLLIEPDQIAALKEADLNISYNLT